MTLDVTFQALIEPAACARPRAVRAGSSVRVYTPSTTHQWQHSLALAARAALPHELITEPVRVDILAVLSRPKRLAGRKHSSGMLWAPVRPDLDNIGKNVLDALRFAWRDDAQVVASTMLKVYAEKDAGPRMVVRVASVATSPDVVLQERGLFQTMLRRI